MNVNDEICADCNEQNGPGVLYYFSMFGTLSGNSYYAHRNNWNVWFHEKCLTQYYGDPYEIIKLLEDVSIVARRPCSCCGELFDGSFLIFGKYSCSSIYAHIDCFQKICGANFIKNNLRNKII